MITEIGELVTEGISVRNALPDEQVFCPRTYTVVVVARGVLHARVCGTCYQMPPYSLLLLRRGDLCSFDSVDATVYTLSFVSTCLYGDATYLLTPFDGARLCVSDAISGGLERQTIRLHELFCEQHRSVLPFARMMLSEILLCLADKPLPTSSTTGFAKAAKYLAEHAEEDISLERLSEEIKISKYHLCRAFRRACGVTPHTYLGYLRILRAEELLEEGMSAGQVGIAVGFRDYSTFFRTYKKLTGKTPTDFGKEEARA